MSGKPSIRFRENTAEAVRDKSLRDAMRNSTDTFTTKRAQGIASVPMEQWRDDASEIRMKVLDNLAYYVDRFSARAAAVGAVVHKAVDAQAAREIIYGILRDRGVTNIVKAKSMVTEEIHLNPYLEERGMRVVETDLGEYIVQLAGESPSHILAPAIHKNRRQIGRLFAEKLGVEYSDDPTVLNGIARVVLRKEFLGADAGISGANFAVADSGSICMFTNEGNGRMVTTLPPLHVAVFTIEKIIPTLADFSSFVRLLPRSATGQPLSSYLSVITGPRKAGEATGAKELHLVLLDNGRTQINEGESREILKCIRCSACMNVCPVYRAVGGHAYDSTYPGPMGIILTSLLDGMERAHPLADATTLCGACSEVCPVKVPLQKLLYTLKERRIREGFAPPAEKAGMAAFGVAVRSPALFSAGQAAARVFWPLIHKMAGEGIAERLPKPALRPFHKRMP
jgi:L-lactate dehydrogenase complex protein LldF